MSKKIIAIFEIDDNLVPDDSLDMFDRADLFVRDEEEAEGDLVIGAKVVKELPEELKQIARSKEKTNNIYKDGWNNFRNELLKEVE